MKFLTIGAALVVASSFLTTCPIADARVQVSPVPSGVVIAPGPLTHDEFWALVDHSVRFGADPEAQEQDLARSLFRLTPDQIADFESLFDSLMRESNRWDLWGAAFVANGGESDDGFEYFRYWLIARGRAVFERVLAHPDDLAEVLPPQEQGGDLEQPLLGLVARTVWAAKTHKDWNEIPFARKDYDAKPLGAPFSEAPAELAKRYPKLWKRFGH